ncbi:HPr protein serine kinase [Erythrobacter sp. NAP1]|uniref:HPr kinase/phosphorylase n=1 Tax=Erythrobacter sp. NAP1 TaxID=237727 RepID=UPI0000686F82|nr:HPr kinase/phosphatase C-terminal domain-containing protein [Erythrobacter sp. NAP1]EAQ29380.1 HPr protein serine kinase [Erythrobacter sp. NAP1]
MPSAPTASGDLMGESMVMQASAVAIDGRALLIEGEPGSGKSSLALALIDRGAQLIGDDGVTLTPAGENLIASPPPNIEGLLEVRGVGLVEMPVAKGTPVALILALGAHGERLPQRIPTRTIMGYDIPCLPFEPGAIAPAQRARWALKTHGLAK